MDRGEHLGNTRHTSPAPNGREWADRKQFKRDHGFHCVACGSGDYLEVHHVR